MNEKETEKIDLALKDLSQFYGTLEYHKVLNALVTDGVAYIMKNGYSWFVTDAIAVIKIKFQNEEFLSITLKLLENNKAKMVITDGNRKILYTQDYEYSDAKREIELFFIDNIMLLTSEY